MKQILIRFLLLFYLTSSYLSATHIHNDAIEQHTKCQVCILAKNLNGTDIPSFDSGCLDCCYRYELIVTTQRDYQQIILKGFNANAPPIS